jgi:hypothetical protein
VANTNKREKIESRWIVASSDGNKLACYRAAWHKNAAFVQLLDTTALTLAPGAYVTLSDAAIMGISQLLRVVQVIDGPDPQSIRLECEGVAAYSLQTVIADFGRGSTGGAGVTGLGYNGLTSVTSLAIGTGSKSFTVNRAEGENAFAVGQRVRIYYTTTPTNYMEGLITSYSGSTLVVNVTLVAGSGTYAAWTFSLVGDAAMTYWMVLDAASISKGAVGAYTPASFTVSGKTQVGGGVAANYLGRFIIADTPDMTNWTLHEQRGRSLQELHAIREHARDPRQVLPGRRDQHDALRADHTDCERPPVPRRRDL